MPDRARPTPFDLVFAPWAGERFGSLREALRAEGHDALDRNVFLMARPAIELIRELRPEDGLGEAMDEFVALIHAAYLYWDGGERLVEVSDARLAALLAEEGPYATPPLAPAAFYVQFPPRRLWGAPVLTGPNEPLDGCFVIRRGDVLDVVAIFGFHPERDGFSVVAISGRRPVNLRREDGSPLFSPVLPGGAAAGLLSLAGMEELLELAWRSLGAG